MLPEPKRHSVRVWQVPAAIFADIEPFNMQKRTRHFRQCFLTLWLGAVSLAGADDFQGATHMVPFDEGSSRYSLIQEDSAVSRLQAKMDRGEIGLSFDDQRGYLPAVMKELKVSATSQMLVFSKTSLQRERISPRTPRAVFFNDDVYLGFNPSSPKLEISVADPALGGIFYTLEQTKVDRPKFVRTDQCLECHASAKSMGVPGHLVRSSISDELGTVDLKESLSQVTQRTPFEERWGGWYVTGLHGDIRHRGNLVDPTAFAKNARTPNYLGNLTNLNRFFAVEDYPSRTSDIVALMVLEHQTHLHNMITRLHYETTLMLKQYGHVNYLRNQVEAFLRYGLFTEEAPITSTITGSPEFARYFEGLGPTDGRGRSLRQFDLKTRLFKYPCSFLIYSDAFDALPGPIKEKIYHRLWDILSGLDTSDDFKGLTPEKRRAVLEILVATKKGLPDYWKL